MVFKKLLNITLTPFDVLHATYGKQVYEVLSGRPFSVDLRKEREPEFGHPGPRLRGSFSVQLPPHHFGLDSRGERVLRTRRAFYMIDFLKSEIGEVTCYNPDQGHLDVYDKNNQAVEKYGMSWEGYKLTLLPTANQCGFVGTGWQDRSKLPKLGR